MGRKVIELTPEEARNYFMQAENYCTLHLPQYIQFQPILDYAAAAIGNTDFKKCLKKRSAKRNDYIYPSSMDNVNYKLLITKDGKYSFRPIQISNPYLYYILVRTITEQKHWEQLQKRFQEFSNEKIEVSSVPQEKGNTDKTTAGVQIQSWWKKLEQRSIELSLEYKYMFMTDINNCYGSIYTHTIDWAITGKEAAKRKNLEGKNKNSLGHTIDTYVSGMQYGQTNGLPMGSELYNFIAEIILGYADMQLWGRMDDIAQTQKRDIDYKILRHRDDYRIFANEKETLEEIVFELQKILADFNFQLNNSKTLMTEDIVTHSIKEDKLAYIQDIPIYRAIRDEKDEKFDSLLDSYQKELFYILSFSKRYPNSGRVRKMLEIFDKRIRVKSTSRIWHIEQLIAICSEIAYWNPKYCEYAISIMSYLVSLIRSTENRKEIVQLIRKKLSRLPNIGMTQLWLQRMTYKADKADGECSYGETLCKLVNGDSVKLWEFGWLRDELYSEFPYLSIVNTGVRDKKTSIIDPEEISLYHDDYDGFLQNS